MFDGVSGPAGGRGALWNGGLCAFPPPILHQDDELTRGPAATIQGNSWANGFLPVPCLAGQVGRNTAYLTGGRVEPTITVNNHDWLINDSVCQEQEGGSRDPVGNSHCRLNRCGT